MLRLFISSILAILSQAIHQLARQISTLLSAEKFLQSGKKALPITYKKLDFQHVFKDHRQPATESYIKQINQVEVEIEFLTDNTSRHSSHANIPIAGVVAQPLRYLSLSLDSPMEFQTFSQVRGHVVSPGAWIFHKGLTFIRRKSMGKLHKDLYGIWYVSSQLGIFSQQAMIELSSFAETHPKCFRSFRKNLLRWLENATPMNWNTLESQDPYGLLSQQHFKKTIQELISFVPQSSSK